MCTKGAKVEQLEDMVSMVDDHLSLEYRWVHRIAHKAEDSGLEATAEKMHAIQHLLADVRAALDEVKEGMEADGMQAAAKNTPVQLV